MTATTDDPRTDDALAEDIDALEGDDFDDPTVEAEQVVPVDRRERTTRVVAAVLAAAAIGLAAARFMGWGPFGSDPDPAAAGGSPIVVQLPQQVIDAIQAAHQPGRLTEFENRPSAQDPSACQTLPPFTNEALYGLAAGDAVALCERVLESGADPCTLWIGVATTDKGAIFYLSSSGQPLPNQTNSVPTKVAVCPPPTAPTTAVPPPTTVPAAPPAQQPGA